MPNRMLRDWTQSDRMDILSAQAEVFFTRLIMKADDFGGFYADTRLLKANLYPLKLDKIREADLLRWMAECQTAGLIVLYEVDQKKYVQIKDFRQRLDKAKAKFPLPPENHVNGDFPESVNDFPAEVEVELEQKKNTNRKRSLVPLTRDAGDEKKNYFKKEYDELVESLKDKSDLKNDIWPKLKAFIEDKKPTIHQPYVDCWNVFAKFYKLSEVIKLSAVREKHLTARLKEPEFEFIKILDKIRISEHLKGISSSWKVTFDFVIESENNYLKILGGNYQ